MCTRTSCMCTRAWVGFEYTMTTDLTKVHELGQGQRMIRVA